MQRSWPLNERRCPCRWKQQGKGWGGGRNGSWRAHRIHFCQEKDHVPQVRAGTRTGLGCCSGSRTCQARSVCLHVAAELKVHGSLWLRAGRSPLSLAPVSLPLTTCLAVSAALTPREQCSSSGHVGCWRQSGSVRPATHPGNAPTSRVLDGWPRPGSPGISFTQQH